MVVKLVDANTVKVGYTIIIEGAPCLVRSVNISKPGAHGHAKVRIEAVNIFDDKKKVIVAPSRDRFEAPLINKARGQVLSVSGDKANVMDLESFETLDIEMGKDMEEIKEGDNVEYWSVGERKIIKRKL
ncbi:MAG: translation initiation factor IF-5A [Nanoarchaeota archaeon]